MQESARYSHSFLRKHYSTILKNNRRIILEGGNGRIDYTDFVDEKIMSLVTLIRLSPEVSSRIAAFEDRLRAIQPDMYFYPQEDYHITVLDILKGEKGRQLPNNIDEYVEAVKACTKDISPFEITFKGISASDNAVMVCGFYDEALELLRQSMRTELKRRGLPLDERYETFSSHVTFARLCSKYTDPVKFLSLISEPVSFGAMTVTSLEVCFHSWCDARKTVIAEISL
jgi:2'-5' RNA ligase